MTERIRLSIISQIADGRPIHMLRPGTFTGQSGVPTTFEVSDIAGIVAAFSAGKRPKPPITEGHDFGRAVGRVHDVWADAAGNLFGRPRWNTSGRQLLADEVYDGFSIELDRDPALGWVMIGGSLTNYPAVSGLMPVTLEAPSDPITIGDGGPEVVTVIPLNSTPGTATTEAAFITALQSASIGIVPTAHPTAPEPAQRLDTTQLQQMEIPTMSDTPSAEPVVAQPTLPPITDPAINARLDAYIAQNQAFLLQRERQIEQRVQAEFERRVLELDQRNAIETFARTATVTATDRPIALSIAPNDLSALLLETPASVRGKWMALISSITRGDGTVSFDEIGSSGESAEAADRWSLLVNAKIATGMSRVDAIRAVSKEHPDLYAAQSAVKTKGGR